MNVVKNNELKKVLLELKPNFKKALLFSVFCDLLLLTPTVYMLEVYDRVVNSRNLMTLLTLTIMAVGLYVVLEILDWSRNGVLRSAGVKFDEAVRDRIFNAVFEARLLQLPSGNAQAFNDLTTVREFLGSHALTALLDAPVSLLYLLIVYAINPILGWVSVAAALLQLLLTYVTEKSTASYLKEGNKENFAAQNYANGSLYNAEVIEAMGMMPGIRRRWQERQNKFVELQAIASDNASGKTALAKLLQLVLGSGLLGLAAWFSLAGELNGGSGMMIVAWILGPKALAPLVQLANQWKVVVNVRDAYGRLNDLLTAVPQQEPGMSLPAPEGNLRVENVAAKSPELLGQMIIQGVGFQLPPGKVLAIVGPSGSGKTTLARLLVGLWPPVSGVVRLDGADIYTWNKEELGPHLGYLPQTIELFDGTVAENIARFGEIDQGAVEAAAKLVGVHEFISQLPEGYETVIGEDGAILSGGQRQRLGLARAIYRNPKYVVLDEPNSSLDESSEAALVGCLVQQKALGNTVVVITHRTNMLQVADYLLIMSEGRMAAFGPRDQVLSDINRQLQGNAALPVKN